MGLRGVAGAGDTARNLLVVALGLIHAAFPSKQFQGEHGTMAAEDSFLSVPMILKFLAWF